MNKYEIELANRNNKRVYEKDTKTKAILRNVASNATVIYLGTLYNSLLNVFKWDDVEWYSCAGASCRCVLQIWTGYLTTKVKERDRDFMCRVHSERRSRKIVQSLIIAGHCNKHLVWLFTDAVYIFVPERCTSTQFPLQLIRDAQVIWIAQNILDICHEKEITKLGIKLNVLKAFPTRHSRALCA